MVRYFSRSTRCVSMAVALAMGLFACAPVRTYVAPKFPFLNTYNAAASRASVVLDNNAWWQRLNDRTLDHLVTLALSDSLSLALARERVIAARAALRAASALGKPSSSAI